MKLGKKPARHGAIQFAFSDYFDVSKLPQPPLKFGHYQDVNEAWGVYGNDLYGDCVFAGAAHETMIWNHEVGNHSMFVDAGVLSDYSAVTGFDPAKSGTDQGTDMQAAANYRRTTGVLDAAGVRHVISAYMSVAVGNVDRIAVATYLFGAVGVGIQFPRSAMEQFNAGEPWDVVPNSPNDGGHYVPCVGRNSHGNLLVVTWGRLHAMTPAFFQRYNDENCAYSSFEMLKDGRSPEGFDQAALESDLKSL